MMLELEKGFITNGGFRAGSGVEKWGGTLVKVLGMLLPNYARKRISDPLTDFTIGLHATYEVDIWHKLHTAKKAAVTRYLATVEVKFCTDKPSCRSR
jgi:hypothetical protein